jgi:hypothetical protein
MILLGVLVLLILLVGGWIVMAQPRFDKDAYHAIFLANNQVYFGKIQKGAGPYLELTDIYYLQVRQQLQPIEGEAPAEGEATEGEEENAKVTEPATPQSRFTLVKLGNEIHGPVDKMTIHRDRILFIEELKEDSRVTKGILEYKAQGGSESESATYTNASSLEIKK